jgi:hypothetical protein
MGCTYTHTCGVVWTRPRALDCCCCLARRIPVISCLAERRLGWHRTAGLRVPSFHSSPLFCSPPPAVSFFVALSTDDCCARKKNLSARSPRAACRRFLCLRFCPVSARAVGRSMPAGQASHVCGRSARLRKKSRRTRDTAVGGGGGGGVFPLALSLDTVCVDNQVYCFYNSHKHASNQESYLGPDPTSCAITDNSPRAQTIFMVLSKDNLSLEVKNT